MKHSIITVNQFKALFNAQFANLASITPESFLIDAAQDAEGLFSIQITIDAHGAFHFNYFSWYIPEDGPIPGKLIYNSPDLQLYFYIDANPIMQQIFRGIDQATYAAYQGTKRKEWPSSKDLFKQHDWVTEEYLEEFPSRVKNNSIEEFTNDVIKKLITNQKYYISIYIQVDDAPCFAAETDNNDDHNADNIIFIQRISDCLSINYIVD